MTKPLEPALRKRLENAVREARRVAEDGARAVLGALAVDAARPHGSMSAEERALRLRLRAHGRQLGDRRERESGAQEIERLGHEVAYEHWHRMLFARFLAENGLLVGPSSRVAVSLEECGELAQEGFGADGWDVAASFAARMLPQIFRPDDPALAVTLAPETRQGLEKLVADLPEAAFTASDALGWTYQFWQTDRKDEVNRSEVKIGADELPAVTQLFTEPYMVRFLLHNTVGAWRAGRLLAERPELARGAASEADLAKAARIAPTGGLDGYDFEYLRFVRVPAGKEGTAPVGESGASDGASRDAGAPLVAAPDTLEGGETPGGPDKPPAGDRGASNRGRASGSAVVPPGSGASLGGPDSPLQSGDPSGTASASPANDEAAQIPAPGGPWRPAAGAFAAWPRRAADLRVLDPCCGSGHFLVEVLELLARLRIEEEGLGAAAAVRAVLRENLSGLEIDLRCTQIAAFNVALAAWKMAGGPIDLPPLRIACSGLAPASSKREWLRLAGGDQRLEGALDRLHELFRDAPTLGSLIDPAALGEDLFQADYEEAAEFLGEALAPEAPGVAPAPGDVAAVPRDVAPGTVPASGAGLAPSVTRAGEAAPGSGADGSGGVRSGRPGAAAAAGSLSPRSSAAPASLTVPPGGRRVEPLAAQPPDRFRTGAQVDQAVVAAGEEGVQESFERAVAAFGMARAAQLLAGEYDLVATNVPYLTAQKQAPALRDYTASKYPDAKADLATAFVSRVFAWLGSSGVQAVVVPQNWLFLPRYRRLRERLLRERTWRFVDRLGEHAFESTAAAGAFAALAVLSAGKPDEGRLLAGIDVSAQRGERPIPAREKAALLLASSGVRGSRSCNESRVEAGSERLDGAGGLATLSREQTLAAGSVRGSRSRILSLSQTGQRRNPDSRIVFAERRTDRFLMTAATSRTGTRTADNPCLLFRFWEVYVAAADEWRPCQSTVKSSQFWAGCESVLRWSGGNGHLQELNALGVASIQGRDAWGKHGVLVSLIGRLPVTLYTGEIFDMNAGVVQASDPRHAEFLWCYLSSPRYSSAVRVIDQQLKLTTATLLKVPFDLAHWRKVAAEKYPNGLPEPYSDDPTQWLFHGHPCGSVVWDEDAKRTAHGPLRADASVLQVAVARLLGYRWPAELDPEMRLAAESREWVRRSEALHPFADEDGIVCLNAAAGEPPAADRLRRLLAAAYEEAWSQAMEGELLAAAAAAADRKRPAASLEYWLRDHFFAEHAKLFHNRPFIWHVWDGRADGFHALVNCHRLCGPDGEGRRTLQALAYRHLGGWIARQLAAQAADEEGADARLAAAQDLQGQLARILEGEPPCDLFVRWHPLHEQPVGWEPNLDDGVRLNIRPFMRAELQTGGRKGAGILRVKPNVKWGKDRGTEPPKLRPREDFPWFYSCPGGGSTADRTDYAAAPEAAYDGSRWNDLHYTRPVKDAMRARRSQEGG